MKNIHVLPTDKPSRLYYFTANKAGYYLYPNNELVVPKNPNCINQNIYITSDEEIKEGDYVCASGGFRFVKTLNNDKARTFEDDGIVSKQNPLSSCHLSNYKKIILTTDQELIQDGVQAIDDEFLEWFVKNPICEEIDVIGNLKYFNVDELRERHLKGLPHLYSEKIGYKIIIPKEEPTIEEEYLKDELKKYDGIDVVILNKPEEPKQETLEEAVQKVANSDDFINGALFGSLWQQERIQNLRDELYNQLPTGEVSSFDLIKIINSHIKKIDEQFKNK